MSGQNKGSISSPLRYLLAVIACFSAFAFADLVTGPCSMTLHSHDVAVINPIAVVPEYSVADNMKVSLAFDRPTLYAGDSTTMTFTLTNFNESQGLKFNFYMPRTFSFSKTVCRTPDRTVLPINSDFPTLKIDLPTIPQDQNELNIICDNVFVGESETFGAYSYFKYLSYIKIMQGDTKFFTGSVPFRTWPIKSPEKISDVTFTPFQPGEDSVMTVKVPVTKFDAKPGDVFRIGSKYLAQFMPAEEDIVNKCIFRVYDAIEKKLHAYPLTVNVDPEAGTIDFYADATIPRHVTDKLIKCNIKLQTYSRIPYNPLPETAEKLSNEADWDYNLHPYYTENQTLYARRVHTSLSEYWIETYGLTMPQYPPPTDRNHVNRFASIAIHEVKPLTSFRSSQF